VTGVCDHSGSNQGSDKHFCEPEVIRKLGKTRHRLLKDVENLLWDLKVKRGRQKQIMRKNGHVIMEVMNHRGLRSESRNVGPYIHSPIHLNQLHLTFRTESLGFWTSSTVQHYNKFIYNPGWLTKSRNPMILSVIHYHQNPSHSTYL
jgi:hypothetical protein